VGLASNVEAINGVTMDSSSEEDVAIMFIYISRGHGFFCELVQRVVTLKIETRSRYSGPC